jgi:hypothetical protein
MSHTSATATNALITPTTAAIGVMISSRASAVKSPSLSVRGMEGAEEVASAERGVCLSGSEFMRQPKREPLTTATRVEASDAAYTLGAA